MFINKMTASFTSIKRRTPRRSKNKRSLKKSKRPRKSRSPRKSRWSPRKSKRRSPRKSKRRSPRKSKRRSPSVKRRTQSAKRTPTKSDYKWMDTSKFQKNSLGKHGYKSSLDITQRHAALEKAVKEYGPKAVWSKLNVVSILNKNRSPKIASVFTTDKNWVKRNYM